MSDIFRKIIVSGNVLEVYTYEKPPKNKGHDLEIEDHYDVLDLNSTTLELNEVERVEERRRQTTRDARNLTRRLALMNFTNGDKFITLTYKKNMKDLKQADEDFKNFIKRFKYHLNISDLAYIAVRERQKRGAIHFHLICNWSHNFASHDEIEHYERLFGADKKFWGHGFVDIKDINHVDNVGAYIIKYMTKDLSLELYKGKKLYLCSQGLERPLVYRGHDANALYDFYNLGQKKEAFTNSYDSEYLGLITYHEYNLVRTEEVIPVQNVHKVKSSV